MGLLAISVPPTWPQHYPENIDASGGAIARTPEAAFQSLSDFEQPSHSRIIAVRF
jgi:hypothetical protein